MGLHYIITTNRFEVSDKHVHLSVLRMDESLFVDDVVSRVKSVFQSRVLFCESAQRHPNAVLHGQLLVLFEPLPSQRIFTPFLPALTGLVCEPIRQTYELCAAIDTLFSGSFYVFVVLFQVLRRIQLNNSDQGFKSAGGSELRSFL